MKSPTLIPSVQASENSRVEFRGLDGLNPKYSKQHTIKGMFLECLQWPKRKVSSRITMWPVFPTGAKGGGFLLKMVNLVFQRLDSS